jgi:hypothetical protein
MDRKRKTDPFSVKFEDLISGKGRFYLMHLSYGVNRNREPLWKFARQKKMIGLDHSAVRGDFPLIQDQVKQAVARKEISCVWVRQFEMLCENMSPLSMNNGDIVVVMAGKDFILGIGRVTGPHKYHPSYRLTDQFFDHVRPVEWVLEYDYEKSKNIPRINKFQRTLMCIEKDKDRPLWEYFSKLVFRPAEPHLVSPNASDDTSNLRALSNIQTELEKETTPVNRYNRSRELVDRLKQLYEFRCQLCSPRDTAIPVIPMKDGRNYVEVHHIKGFDEVTDMTVDQESGDYVIDTYRNAVVVCVYHHKLLHKHKNEFSYNSVKLSFISKDGSREIPINLNRHLYQRKSRRHGPRRRKRDRYS